MKNMLVVNRRVRRCDKEGNASFDKPSETLADYRDTAVWILLGEPGAGKTESLKKEAESSGGIHIRIADFIHTDTSEFEGKDLFLDGLDEVRGGTGSESILSLVRRQLKRLGHPKYRIACRAADWYGSTDREDLRGTTSDSEIPILLLEPLLEDDIHKILQKNHDIPYPDRFLNEARKRGIENLLENPQTLGLLANAIRANLWPETREETFRLACEKLAEESNKRHRDAKRIHPVSTEAILDASGHLCAALLLADKTGVALDTQQANDRFPVLEKYTPPDSATASEALRCKLFRPEGVERLIPSHRSIAEYLAARWIARRVDEEGLPLGRILNLLLGRDGRTVSGLRGLYGWLALLCRTARRRLIAADPLTVVIYGDAKPLTSEDRQLILSGLKREAEIYTGFHRDASSSHQFGALADPALTETFLSILESPGRDDASQAFTDCILEALSEGEPISELSDALKKIVMDESRWMAVRKTALHAWLNQFDSNLEEPATLLDDITSGRINDPDDELAGKILLNIYPKHSQAQDVLNHLHTPKNESLFGSFVYFWVYTFPEVAPESDLPFLLDTLVRINTEPLADLQNHHLSGMAAKLLARGIQLHGKQIAAEQLFTWLGIIVDKYGEIRRSKDEVEVITKWIEANPQRYKELLSLCFESCCENENIGYCLHICERRLLGAQVPEDIGLWHLEQSSLSMNDALSRLHLERAVEALMYQHGHCNLSLEDLEAWADSNPWKRDWLKQLLKWDIPDWRIEQAERKRSRYTERLASRRARTIYVSPHIPAISSGSANVGLMHELAGVWKKHYTDIPGETLSERFDNYCENGREVLTAANSGFIKCSIRTDLPSVTDIIKLSNKSKEHLIRLPCLVGMELLWEKGESELQQISDDNLRRMIAFRLTYGIDSAPEWFTYLVTDRPAIVAEVLTEYACAALKSKHLHIESIYPLAHDTKYKGIALHAAPRILRCFPIRAKSQQLHYLEYLLKAALMYRIPQLQEILDRKTSLKSMDVTQKVYWLAAGVLLNSERYEDILWHYIGKSWQRANGLSAFLSKDSGTFSNEFQLSARTLGKLIELLAPHAETDWPTGGGRVTEAMNRGDRVRGMVNRLGTIATEEAVREIDRLLAVPALKKLKFQLENARYQLRLKQRENEFSFPPLNGITQVLMNRAPADIKDLAALALEHIDDIAKVIRQENDDGFRAFWNIKNKKPDNRRDENVCRDEILRQLRPRLKPFGIDCQPESDYSTDKRADIRLSLGNKLDLPIEIKRDDNDELWGALRSQLIEQYTISPKASGHGIYLVLWFGEGRLPPATDGGKKPRSPAELRIRLESQLDQTDRSRIFIRIMDVSWPQ